jgi:hypothetical protein
LICEGLTLSHDQTPLSFPAKNFTKFANIEALCLTESEKIKVALINFSVKNIMDMIDLSNLTFEDATPDDVAEMIAALELYRDRLVSDSMAMAQRAKIMKSQAQSRLDPNLAQIDSTLQQLREKQAAFTN